MKFVVYPDGEWRHSHRSRYVKYIAVDNSIKKFNHAVSAFNKTWKEGYCARISYVSDNYDKAGAVYIGVNFNRVHRFVPSTKITKISSSTFIATGLLKKPRKPRKKKVTELTNQQLNGLLADLVQADTEERKKEEGKTFIW